jgi:hypothetical protein
MIEDDLGAPLAQNAGVHHRHSIFSGHCSRNCGYGTVNEMSSIEKRSGIFAGPDPTKKGETVTHFGISRHDSGF